MITARSGSRSVRRTPSILGLRPSDRIGQCAMISTWRHVQAPYRSGPLAVREVGRRGV